jgi:hypothetical protein
VIFQSIINFKTKVKIIIIIMLLYIFLLAALAGIFFVIGFKYKESAPTKISGLSQPKIKKVLNKKPSKPSRQQSEKADNTRDLSIDEEININELTEIQNKKRSENKVEKKNVSKQQPSQPQPQPTEEKNETAAESGKDVVKEKTATVAEETTTTKKKKKKKQQDGFELVKKKKISAAPISTEAVEEPNHVDVVDAAKKQQKGRKKEHQQALKKTSETGEADIAAGEAKDTKNLSDKKKKDSERKPKPEKKQVQKLAAEQESTGEEQQEKPKRKPKSEKKAKEQRPRQVLVQNPYDSEDAFWDSTPEVLSTTTNHTGGASAQVNTVTIERADSRPVKKSSTPKASSLKKPASSAAYVTINSSSENPWGSVDSDSAAKTTTTEEFPALGARLKPKKTQKQQQQVKEAHPPVEELNNHDYHTHKRVSETHFEVEYQAPDEKKLKLNDDFAEQATEDEKEQQQQFVETS